MSFRATHLGSINNATVETDIIDHLNNDSPYDAQDLVIKFSPRIDVDIHSSVCLVGVSKEDIDKIIQILQETKNKIRR